MVFFSQGVAALEDGEKFQDWTARCEQPEGEARRCFIFQTLINNDNNQPILQVAVGYLAGSDQPAAIFTVPLGVALRAGLELKIDGGEAIRIPFERCEPGGCIAGLGFDDKLLAAFKKGIKSQVVLHDGAGRPVSLEVSLQGFTAGFTALR